MKRPTSFYRAFSLILASVLISANPLAFAADSAAPSSSAPAAPEDRKDSGNGVTAVSKTPGAKTATPASAAPAKTATPASAAPAKTATPASAPPAKKQLAGPKWMDPRDRPFLLKKGDSASEAVLKALRMRNSTVTKIIREKYEKEGLQGLQREQFLKVLNEQVEKVRSEAGIRPGDCNGKCEGRAKKPNVIPEKTAEDLRQVADGARTANVGAGQNGGGGTFDEDAKKAQERANGLGGLTQPPERDSAPPAPRADGGGEPPPNLNQPLPPVSPAAAPAASVSVAPPVDGGGAARVGGGGEISPWVTGLIGFGAGWLLNSLLNRNNNSNGMIGYNPALAGMGGYNPMTGMMMYNPAMMNGMSPWMRSSPATLPILAGGQGLFGGGYGYGYGGGNGGLPYSYPAPGAGGGGGYGPLGLTQPLAFRQPFQMSMTGGYIPNLYSGGGSSFQTALPPMMTTPLPH